MQLWTGVTVDYKVLNGATNSLHISSLKDGDAISLDLEEGNVSIKRVGNQIIIDTNDISHLTEENEEGDLVLTLEEE